jgi:hypothetical protein
MNQCSLITLFALYRSDSSIRDPTCFGSGQNAMANATIASIPLKLSPSRAASRAGFRSQRVLLGLVR